MAARAGCARVRPPSEESRTLGTADLDREIAAEQSYLSRLYTQLDTQRARTATALDQVRREPAVPTPGGRTERDAFDALHSQRLRRLAAAEERLAFGRLDLAAGERRYIGRIGLSDDDQTQLLLDWRAPAAAAFYQATAAAPGGVARRRHLATRGRQVIGIDDELLDAEALDGDAVTIAGDGALMAALTAHRTGRMRDIVATLQAEQDEVVRAPLEGVLVVQGGPGTGKTAVALHRAAYLLYTHRDRIARSGVLVVGPTPVFLRYIEQVLPSLGESGVLLATPPELFPGIEATESEPVEVAALKGDARLATVLRAAVRARQRLLDGPVRLRVEAGGEVITLQPQVVAEARTRARQTGRPHNDARVTFVRHVLDDLAAQLAQARRIDLDEDSRADLLAELRDSRDVRREVNLRWMPLTAPGVLSALFASPDRMTAAASGVLTPAEQRLLRRDRDAGWTPADVPLLDEVAELVGADVEVTAAEQARTLRERAEAAEALAYAQAVLEASGEAAAMMTPQMLAERFAVSDPERTLAERAHTDRAWTFGHAVIDEAQELSPMAWRMIARRVPSRSLTVVGDLAQTSSPAGSSSWAQVREALKPAHWEVRELTVNYRTPASVMEVAAATAQAAGLHLRPPRSARTGEWPPAARRLSGRLEGWGGRAARAAAADAVDVLLTDDAVLSGGRLAVVTPRTGHPEMAAAVADLLTGHPDLAPRVEVFDVDGVKGLEFDAVVVLDPAAILAESARGAGDLYVALTRCTQRLTVLHRDDLPAGLDQLAAAEPRRRPA